MRAGVDSVQGLAPGAHAAGLMVFSGVQEWVEGMVGLVVGVCFDGIK